MFRVCPRIFAYLFKVGKGMIGSRIIRNLGIDNAVNMQKINDIITKVSKSSPFEMVEFCPGQTYHRSSARIQRMVK